MLLCFVAEIGAGVLYPAYETLNVEMKSTQRRVSHWMTYWSALAIINLAYQFLYFLPFSYEARVLLVVSLAHPKLEGPELIQNVILQNPRVKIMATNMR